jgi:5-methylcytosine-specific restriction enzyme subunit McrC
MRNRAALLVENGAWRPIVDIASSGAAAEALNRDALTTIGTGLKRSLGLRSDPFEFRAGPRGTEVRVTGIAGTVSAHDFVFDVAPKFAPQGEVAQEWDASLLILMQHAGRRHISFHRSQKLATARQSFVDLLAMAFVDAVKVGLSDQLIQTYQVQEERLPVVRGRLNLQRQIVSVFWRPHLLECDVDQLDSANPFNGLLKWAAQAFVASARSPSLRRNISELINFLPGRPDRSLALRGIRITPPPQFRAWSEALDIASLLSSGLTHTASRGSQHGYSFVFNMERLFEHFVQLRLSQAVKLMPASNVSVSAQVRTRYAVPVDGESAGFFSRPDNIIFRGTKPLAVIDAKYKRLSDSSGTKDRKPTNQDVYELVAAMTAQRCSIGLLVYPKVFGDTILADGELHSWRVESFGVSLHVGAVALDLMKLRSLSDLLNIDQRLVNGLNALLAQSGTDAA